MTPSSPGKRHSERAPSRRQIDLQTKHHPTADGKPAPVRGSRDRNDQIKLEFLAAYCRLNRCHATLLRTRSRTVANPAKREQSERVALRRIEKALRWRDELEDQYAPYGVIAEPVTANGFTVDVRFSFGNIQSVSRSNPQILYSSAYVSIPLPLGGKSGELKTPSKKEHIRSK